MKDRKPFRSTFQETQVTITLMWSQREIERLGRPEGENIFLGNFGIVERCIPCKLLSRVWDSDSRNARGFVIPQSHKNGPIIIKLSSHPPCSGSDLQFYGTEPHHHVGESLFLINQTNKRLTVPGCARKVHPFLKGWTVRSLNPMDRNTPFFRTLAYKNERLFSFLPGV